MCPHAAGTSCATRANTRSKRARRARELTLTIAGRTELEPDDRVELTLAQLGAAGVFRVSELVHTISARGETTELTLWEE